MGGHGLEPVRATKKEGSESDWIDTLPRLSHHRNRLQWTRLNTIETGGVVMRKCYAICASLRATRDATLTGFEPDYRISCSCAILTELRANQRVNRTCTESALCRIRANKRTPTVRLCPTFRRSDNPHARVEWSIGVQWQSGRGLHPHVRDRSQIRQYPIGCRSEVTPETIRPPEKDQRPGE